MTRQDDSGALRELASRMEQAAMHGLGGVSCSRVRQWAAELGELAALSPQGSEPAGVGEPVAWLVIYRGRVIGYATADTKDMVRLAEGETLIPAYASPAPAQQAVTDEIVERVALAIYAEAFGYSPEAAAKKLPASDFRDRYIRLAKAALQPTTAQGDSDA